MSLTPGTRLGPYVIIAPLGRGGMGEVYRASDARLGRDVAIKALPEALTTDPERLARFDREARILASLSHPHIAGIHGLEEVDGTRYLVLEYVEGETLAERLARGPLPADDALEIARQIAAGIEAAHESGVIHRDLKPANVMLTPGGTVKVLDFGLAKPSAASDTARDSNLSASPTMTYAPTEQGLILGTVAYMSPEQARGRAVDKRADIWAFGCVLYECLTARQAFSGETVSDTIATILRTDVEWSVLPPATPARARELIARCLCKDPRDRLRDIGEARILLGAIPAGATDPAPVVPGARGVRLPLWLAAASAVGLATLAVVVTLLARPRTATGPVRRLDFATSDIGVDFTSYPMISPDGMRIAYVSKNQIWVRNLDQLDPHAIVGVDGLSSLAWSPDSRSIVFSDRKKLWKAPGGGGAPTVLCDIPETGSLTGLTWSRSGSVAFAVWRGSIYQVPAAGGSVSVLVQLDPKEIVDFHAPSWLANGDLMFLVHFTSTDSTASQRPKVTVLSDGRQYPVRIDFTRGYDMPTVTATGQLLFMRRGTGAGVWGAPYDVARRRTTGPARMVASGAEVFSVSEEGSLLYVEGGSDRDLDELVWVDRSGRVTGTVGAAHRGVSGVALSPDGRRIAFTSWDAGNEDVWVHDIARGTQTRVTFGTANESRPQWLGSSRLTYLEASHMSNAVLATNADGSGGRAVLAAPPSANISQRAYVAADGRSAVRLIEESGRYRLRTAPIEAGGALGPATPFLRFQPEPKVSDVRLSASGGLLAYSTDDPGVPEVFLVRYPSGEGPWQISNDGGRQPRWAGESGELFYLGGGGPTRRSMVAVPIDASSNPPGGTPKRLFDIDQTLLGSGGLDYDVAADGKRFLVVRSIPGRDGRPARMVLVQNWESDTTGHEAR